MRRRRKTGNVRGSRKGTGKAAEEAEVTPARPLEESESIKKGEGAVSRGSEAGGMSVTAMDVVDTRTHQHFGHGHHTFLHSGGTRGAEPEMELVPPTQNSKAVGARKRKPTQISKVSLQF